MTPAQRQHEIQVAALAADYRQQGYTVSVPADRESVPFDLHGYLPDVLAEKDAEHLLVLLRHFPLAVCRI
jgi:hypothetical protein